MNQLLDFTAVCLLAVNLVLAVTKLRPAILLCLFSKPIIDMGWDFKFLGFSLIDVHSLLFIALGYVFIARRKAALQTYPGLVLLWALAHFGLLFLVFLDPMVGIESILRALFFPLGLVLFWAIWQRERDRKPLLLVLLVASAIPSAIAAFQGLGLIPHETISLTKGLVRSNGYYHDIVTIRIYIIQGLLALFLCYKTGVVRLGWLAASLLLAVFLLGGFFIYSKAFVGIVVIGLILFLITERHFKAVLVVGFLTALVGLFYFDRVVEVLDTLFIKEIGFNEGSTDAEELFSGRGMLIINYTADFARADVVTQVFGFHDNDGRTHNEFLRILILSGVFGLIFYVVMMGVIVLRSVLVALKNRPLAFIALWCVAMMLIDAVSVVWGLYPYYLVSVLGFWVIAVRTTWSTMPDRHGVMRDR